MADILAGAPTTILTREHVAEIVRRAGRDVVMDRVIAALADAIASVHDAGVTPPRGGLVRGAGASGMLEWMPHLRRGHGATIKLISYTPENPDARGLPTILGTITRFDDATGRLVLLCDGPLLTAVRTGAAS